MTKENVCLAVTQLLYVSSCEKLCCKLKHTYRPRHSCCVFFLMTRLLRKLCYTLCPYLRLPVMSCMRYVYWISSAKIPFESFSCRSALNELLNVADKTVCSVKWYMSWGNVDNGAGRNAIHLYLEIEIRGISITATIESITTKFLLIVI